jgi:hypothetical protein
MKPQIIYLALSLAGLLLSANKHGKPKEGNYNFWISAVSCFITLYLLYWGGFFNILLKQ